MVPNCGYKSCGKKDALRCHLMTTHKIDKKNNAEELQHYLEMAGQGKRKETCHFCHKAFGNCGQHEIKGKKRSQMEAKLKSLAASLKLKQVKAMKDKDQCVVLEELQSPLNIENVLQKYLAFSIKSGLKETTAKDYINKLKLFLSSIPANENFSVKELFHSKRRLD